MIMWTIDQLGLARHAMASSHVKVLTTKPAQGMSYDKRGVRFGKPCMGYILVGQRYGGLARDQGERLSPLTAYVANSSHEVGTTTLIKSVR